MKGLWWILIGVLVSPLGAQTLRIGVAEGFPPYQYRNDQGPVGLDVALAEAVAAEAGLQLKWTQGPWDDLMATLRLTKELDLLTGAEVNPERASVFLFSHTLYRRRNALFILATEPRIHTLEDLVDRPVARDREAYSETLLAARGLKDRVRLIRTNTKEEAWAALVSGRVVAAFMPEAVGRALALRTGVAVRILDLGDPGTPVAFALRRDRLDLLARLNPAIERLVASGALDRLLHQLKLP